MQKGGPETTWGYDQPDLRDAPPRGWRLALAGLRAVLMVAVLIVGLSALLLLRLIERPVFGLYRPWTPWITQITCRLVLWVMGLRLTVRGAPLRGRGVVVANHTSWLDIFVLNATQRVYFVSKDDVRSWPGIGILARATGTIFIRRTRSEARAQVDLLQSRLAARHRLLIFPEGTSSDGCRVLPFRAPLFAAFTGAGIEGLAVQPATVCYHAPPGKEPRFFGWWGTQGFAGSLLRVLSAAPQGRVTVLLHDPIPVAGVARKALAAQCETTIRAGMEAEGITPP